MTTCPTEPRLTACLLGDLPQAEADDVRAHIASCPACRAAAAELAPLLDTLRAALAADAAAPLALDPARLTAILATPPPTRARRRRTRFWLGPVIGLAATLLIVLSASLFFPGFESRPYRVPKGSGDRAVATRVCIDRLNSSEVAYGYDDGISHETEFRAGEEKPVFVRKVKKRAIVDREGDLAGETDTENQPGWTSYAWLIKDGRGGIDGTYSKPDKNGDASVDHTEAGLLEGKINLKSGKLIKATELGLGSASRAAAPEPPGDDKPVSHGTAVEQVKAPVILSYFSRRGAETGQKDGKNDTTITDRPYESKEGIVLHKFSAKEFHFPPLNVGGTCDIPERRLREEVKTESGPMWLQDSTVAEEVEKESRSSYFAEDDNGRVHSKGGKMGAGGGKTGGWPDDRQDNIERFYEERPDTPVKPALPAPPAPTQMFPPGATRIAPPAPGMKAPAKPPKAEPAPAKPRVPAVFNPFVAAAEQPLSTFAIDVDTASYTRTRQAILAGQLPEPEAVRTEEVVNAFDYGDRAPDHATFRIFVEGSPAPFGHGTSLVRLGIKGRRLGREEARPAVLTFVVDASGSMAQPDRFGLARLALAELLGRLGPDDRIQLIAFNDTARVLADPAAATGGKEVLAAFDRIQCTGSTHLEAGLRLAYDRAAAAFRPGAENRVILLSDGVANLGAGAAADILTHIDAARRQGITLAVFGVGRGAYNDEMLEQLANRGDGTYRFLDAPETVRRAFVDDLAATLYTIASDVKIQVEWFPAAVSRYRQLGYENRALTAEQFRDDTVDAGEIGSGQSVTALYEIERLALAPRAAAEAPLGMVRVRYRPSGGGPVAEISRSILAADLAASFQSTRPQFRLAACAAAFAERLRGSPYANGFSFAEVADVLRPSVMEFKLDARLADLLRLIEAADRLAK
ncbi:MAG: DUF3520 domain-containing protein [Lentisphaerae bacterium]|nr:DUF3520 domain-containing protein [Lentisphaerota bacterium]